MDHREPAAPALPLFALRHVSQERGGRRVLDDITLDLPRTAAALIPTINGLMVVGLVQLPGMMTGQILAGQSPLLAVRYQIVVAFMLGGATAVTAAIVVLWYRRTFFTPAAQLADRVPV